ncbi:MAG: kelch repeat-containing protein [Thermoplasmata archaeon]|nr:kelch repeat-containing protein [Thermoplasmata archaeon]
MPTVSETSASPATLSRPGTGALAAGQDHAFVSADPGRAPTWQNLTAVLSSNPGSRSGAAAAFDVSDDEAVVFGGFGVADQPTGGTWVYSNGSWSHPKTSGTPSARAGAAMTYDPLTGQVIMFGGHGAGGPLSDTWTFANNTWTNITATAGAAPSKRFFAAMAWDSADGEAVLFGGRNYVTVLNDTWEFLAGTWKNISVASGSPNGTPAARYSASFTFDDTNQTVVLFGGNGTLSTTARVLGDTWWFRGGHWSLATPSTSPSPRFGAALVDDDSVGALVLFGGESASGASENDTWTYANGTWTGPLAIVGATPSPRSEPAAVAYLGSSTQDSFLLLVGGGTSNGGILNDTWIFGSETIVGVAVEANRSGMDLGQSVQFVASPIGGAPPFSYSWSGNSAPLPSGCTSAAAPSLRCVVTSTGRFDVAVNVSESAGGPVTQGVGTVTVNPNLRVASLTALPYPYHLGHGTLTISAAVLGGTSPLMFSYSGLPPGCPETNATNLTCIPTGSGDFEVTLTVTDAAGENNVTTSTVVVDGPSGASGWSTGETLAVAGVALLAVAVVVVLVWRRRRGATSVPGPASSPVAR